MTDTPPPASAQAHFLRYCENVSLDELWFLLGQYRLALRGNEMEIRQHTHAGNGVELARSEARRAENSWRLMIVIGEIERRGCDECAADN